MEHALPQRAADPPPILKAPPPHSRLRYESTPDGITVRSAPPPPVAAIALSVLVIFIPSIFWVMAYEIGNKVTFATFLNLILIAVAITLLATSSLIAFLRRLSAPPTWHVTPAGLTATKAGNLFTKRLRFERSEIVTIRGDDSAVQVVTRNGGRWRAHSFPLLTLGGGWLAELIGTTLHLTPLPHQYLVTRVPDETAPPGQITYGIEGAGPCNLIATVGVPAVPPEGDPPAGAAVRIRRDGGSWTVTRSPPGRFERLATWALLAVAILLLIYGIARSSNRVGGAALALVLAWAFFGRPLRERFARTCGPTILAYEDDTLDLTRPTGWGTHRQTTHWWMIRSVDLRPAVRRGRPLADVCLRTRAGSTIPLFPSLPERDARWVAALVAGTFAMEEAEPTWSPPAEPR